MVKFVREMEDRKRAIERGGKTWTTEKYDDGRKVRYKTVKARYKTVKARYKTVKARYKTGKARFWPGLQGSGW